MMQKLVLLKMALITRRPRISDELLQEKSIDQRGHKVRSVGYNLYVYSKRQHSWDSHYWEK